MQSSDREHFLIQLARLCAGFDIPVTKAREDAYWSGLAAMSLAQFARCIDFAVGPHYDDEKFPTTGRLWKIHRSFRSAPQHAIIEQPIDSRDHLEYYANRLLLRHMGHRLGLGSKGRFMPGYGLVECVASPELLACRQATKAITNWFRGPVSEGAEDATPAAFIEAFIRAIAAVSVITPTTLLEWAEQVKDPLAQLPFPAWMARPLAKSTDTDRPLLELT